MDRTNYCADCEQHAREVARLKAELADWQSSADRAAGEMCGDEKHCTCVPVLRKQLAEARVLVERAYKDGWVDGFCGGAGNDGFPADIREEHWLESDARAALDAARGEG